MAEMTGGIFIYLRLVKEMPNIITNWWSILSSLIEQKLLREYIFFKISSNFYAIQVLCSLTS